tara:strand:+ start:78 stop:770 length:693 start_codon:yes stop_codon:yes gene_type:complete
MNYQNIYESLITKRQKNPAKGYTERHHILPKSLGGSDDPTNLVVLSGREHWVAHLLLHKIHNLDKTLFACHMMAMRCEERGIPFIKYSRMYERIRVECAKRTHLYTSKSGESNSQYGTMWISNIELQENKKISNEESLPKGWVRGRNKWKDTIKNNINKERKKEKESNKREYAYDLFNEFAISGATSIRKFVKHSDYPHSHVSLTMLWKKYIKEYNPERSKSFSCSVVDR